MNAKISEMYPIRGLWNCHVRGLHSLVLRDRVDDSNGMIRVFYAEQGALCYKPGQIEFPIMPHNHRQDITLTNLFGNAANYVYTFEKKLRRGVEHLHEYEFGSALLDGSFTLIPKGRKAIDKVSYRELSDVPQVMKSWEVHTIGAWGLSAWLVEEGQLATHGTLCYSREPGKVLSSDGLYIPMSAGDIETCWKYIRKRV